MIQILMNICSMFPVPAVSAESEMKMSLEERLVNMCILRPGNLRKMDI